MGAGGGIAAAPGGTNTGGVNVEAPGLNTNGFALGFIVNNNVTKWILRPI